MARIRYLKMGFFENEELSSLSAYHRLCFAGLWLLSDREGRIEDRPKRIHAKLFPYEPSLEMDSLLHDLAASGFITRYIVGQDRVIQVVNFHEHQRPRHDEQVSTLPAQPLDALGRPLSIDATGPTNTRSKNYEQQPLTAPMNTSTVEHEHQQQLTETATNQSRNSDKSPLGIGIGIGIGIGTGGPPAFQNSPLIARGAHKNHAYCGKVCLPASLLESFRQRMGHLPERDAADYVSRFFDGWNARYTSGDRAGVVVGEDAFDFWRDRWKESHPSATKTTARQSGKFLSDVPDEIAVMQPKSEAS